MVTHEGAPGFELLDAFIRIPRSVGDRNHREGADSPNNTSAGILIAVCCRSGRVCNTLDDVRLNKNYEKMVRAQRKEGKKLTVVRATQLDLSDFTSVQILEMLSHVFVPCFSYTEQHPTKPSLPV